MQGTLGEERSINAKGSDEEISALRFSTDVIPKGKRVEAWRKAIHPLFDFKSSSGYTENEFEASLHSYHFGAIILCHAFMYGGRYQRSVERVRMDDLNHYVIHQPLTGSTTFGVEGNWRRLRKHDIAVLDMTAQADFRIRNQKSLNFIVPRPALPMPNACRTSLHGLVVPREKAIGTLLSDIMIAAARAASKLKTNEAMPIGNALARIVASTVNPCSDSNQTLPFCPQREIANRIRDYIEDNLYDELLKPATLVKELGISRSKLYRQFESFGGVHRYITKRRLQRSLAAICDPFQIKRRIADIAYEQGFTDAAYFSRLFRQTYGMSPRSFQEAIRRGENIALPSMLSAGETAPLVEWLNTLSTR
ncbi:helix-turn-helix domain-containing protein [Eilatimonas milleporae]|uniref:AraC family transcriptional regulator n=1 Tax=Eilatimonas milleporae TaxID=911205 RepID=A0A3M0D7P3_9PROT|nr:helix-turn-helix domain-containing protein [Eilatimonas milleporae]RMB12293.1 AraC family transcriptional regulator [Eilatimonas milleporae]